MMRVGCLPPRFYHLRGRCNGLHSKFIVPICSSKMAGWHEPMRDPKVLQLHDHGIFQQPNTNFPYPNQNRQLRLATMYDGFHWKHVPFAIERWKSHIRTKSIKCYINIKCTSPSAFLDGTEYSYRHNLASSTDGREH